MSRATIFLAALAALLLALACREHATEPERAPPPSCTPATTVRLDEARSEWVVSLVRCLQRPETYVDDDGYVRVRTVVELVTMTCRIPAATATQEQAVAICEARLREIYGGARSAGRR